MTDVNNNLTGSGFPAAIQITDLHAIRKTCVFYYETGAANAPVSDRGGMGICMYRHDSWIDLMVIPYAQTKTYTAIKRDVWSEWAYDYLAPGPLDVYADAQSCMNALLNWVTTIKANTIHGKTINCNYGINAAVSGELYGGIFSLIAFRNGLYANIIAFSYWGNRPIFFGIVQNGQWHLRFVKCPVSPGLGVSQNVLYQSGSGIYFEVGEQNDFTRLVINSKWVAIEHFTNNTKDKTITLWDGK